MPPAAATECERTGWTLLMIATVAPASAAARAARWPASPAPMIRTSWDGMGRRTLFQPAPGRRPGSGPWPTSASGAESAAQLVHGDDALKHALPVDGEDRAQPAQSLRAQQRLQRLVRADAPRGAVVLQGLAGGERGLPRRQGRVDGLAAQDAE